MLEQFRLFRVFIPALVFLTLLFTQKAEAQDPLFDTLVRHWHKAYFAEVRNDNSEAINEYNTVIDLSDNQPPTISEWYKGAAYLNIALIHVRTRNRKAARKALQSAVSHHFWNFVLLRSNSVLDTVFGKRWMDSLQKHWESVRRKELSGWHPQPTLILRPNSLRPDKKYPLIIALHGGNQSYEVFSRRLNRLQDTLGAIIVIPAGVHRYSEISNSWDDDIAAGEKKIDSIITELSDDPNVDINDISLLGYSQGSQMAYEYALLHPERIRRVIAFSGFAPTVVNDKTLQRASKYGLKVFAVSGMSDSPDFIRSTEKLKERMTQFGIQFNLKLERDLPHGLPFDIKSYCKEIWNALRK